MGFFNILWLCIFDSKNSYLKFIIIIIIIISNRQYGFLWPSQAIRPYRPSLPVGLQGYILYRHRAIEYVLAGRPAFARPCNGVHGSTSP